LKTKKTVVDRQTDAETRERLELLRVLGIEELRQAP
jgi:hypothetical protein